MTDQYFSQTPPNNILTWKWDWIADPTAEGYIFQGWCTSENGSGLLLTAASVAVLYGEPMTYTTGSTMANAELTYYAIWEADVADEPVVATITKVIYVDGEDGGVFVEQVFDGLETSVEDYEHLLEMHNDAYRGYSFGGWSDGDVEDGTITYTAIWNEIAVVE